MNRTAESIFEVSVYLVRHDQVAGCLVAIRAPSDVIACAIARAMLMAGPECQRHGWRVADCMALEPDQVERSA